MRVKSISIQGMHKINKKRYLLNDDVTYFVGDNGAGKSTILQAIQLAILGYIPRYSKTNESIMRHSNCPAMSVVAELDSGMIIERSWTKSKSSVSSEVHVKNEKGEDLGNAKECEEAIQSLVGQIELPVFNFDEFRSMTANKLKEWFITFLPSSSENLNMRKELEDALGSRQLGSEYLLDDICNWIETSGLEGLELVKALNIKFKEDQSYAKGRISELEGTIQSLVRYDDAEDLDDSVILDEINDLNNLKSAVMKYQASADMYQKAIDAINQLKSQLPATSLDEDERISTLKKEIDDLNKQNEVLTADYSDLQNQVRELEHKKSLLPRAGATCPYTNEKCDTAAALVAKTRAESEEIDKQIAFKQDEMKDCDPVLIRSNSNKIMQLQAELGAIQNQYDRLVSMEIQVKGSEVGEPPTDMNLLQIDEKIRLLQDKLVQIQANKKYDELSDKVTKDKFKLQNELEAYKIWAKKTDANGLQTTLMNKPFENLAKEMSSYLTQMFNTETIAQFNLITKANSFSFGLVREDQYIEFDCLSSGEKCLFTLALIMCILNKSESSIRTILIDDILDHLDSSNANYLFNALKGVKDIQFILAGVKDCNDESIISRLAD